MISRTALEERVREWQLREEVVEKDYVLGWLLWGIGAHERLASNWVFKGGTCLKKCYIETYRFSEDLDFTVLPGGPIAGQELDEIFREVLQRVTDESGINFSGRPPLFRPHESGFYTQGRIYFQGPRNAPNVSSIILDLSVSERVVRPTVVLPIMHVYPDGLPEPGTVQCYAFEELFAEKIRAMGERSRPRDLYDIINLYRRPDLGTDPRLIHRVLMDKCQHKGVPVPTYESISASPFRAELESEWEHMLAHQLLALPPFASLWGELQNLFAWLGGARPVEALAPVPAAAEEEGAEALVLPRSASLWGFGVPLETIRFAGANRLCVKLGYEGTTRIIEPYSLRRTKDRNIILHAVRRDDRAHRSYRVDRIDSVQPTNEPFTPVYDVEFSRSGPIHALPTRVDYGNRRTSVFSRPQRASASRPTYPGTTYIIECPYCEKRFRRNRLDTTLNPHKNKLGGHCPGRRGTVASSRF